jgi:2-methylcitrate dehydratase PrpD
MRRRPREADVVTDATLIGPTVTLARFAAATPLAALPSGLRQRLKECLLDFVGNAAFAAAFAESSPAFRAGTLALGHAAGDATVVGEAGAYAPMQAALLNGAFAHTLDFDDTNAWGVLHPGAPVIAAALVEAERQQVSGAQLLAALGVGYEVACRIGASLGQTAYDRGFHVTGVAGLFGAVAACGRLRGLDDATIACAFGIALSKASGSMQYLENGAWNKRLHPGFAAHDALLALEFAAAGVLGATAPLEGRYGLSAGYTNKATLETLTDRLGVWWPSQQTALKPFPGCRLTHGAIEATLGLRVKAGAQPHDALSAALRAGERLQVRLSPKAVQIVGERLPTKLHPLNVVDAQFSAYFQVAVAWIDGHNTWRSYERLGAPDVRALCDAIDVAVDESLPLAGGELTLGDLTVRVEEPLGEDARPFDGAPLRAKYDSLAVPVFGKVRSAEIARRVAALEEEPRAAALIRLLRRSA